MSEFILSNYGQYWRDVMEDYNKKTLKIFRETTMELDRIYSMFSKSCGLSEPEYWSLLLIYEGVETQSKICEKLSLSRQTLNSAFKQLIKKELIYLEPYENNLRTKKTTLTEKGLRFVEKNILLMHSLEEQAWSKMTTEEQSKLSELSGKFRDYLTEAFDNFKNKNQ